MTATAPITVCIGTYGDLDHWGPLAQRAIASVLQQDLPPAGVRWCHDDALHWARNHAAMSAGADWLCFLDADDELDSGYLAAMADMISLAPRRALIQPATLGIHADGHEDPHPFLIPAKPLIDGNYLIIGTLIQTGLFVRLGGFHNWPCYEDWDLWLRAEREGAVSVTCADAVYRVHVNETGRNSASRDEQVRVYNQIRARHQNVIVPQH